MGWNIGTCSARKRLRSGRRWCGFVAGHGDVPERTSPLADSPRAIQASLDTRIAGPISKSSEQDNEAGELDESEEVLWMKLPTHKDAALPLDPCEEPLDEPTP